MASAASSLHEKAAVAVCFVLILLSFTSPSAMAAYQQQQADCSTACDNACRAYGEAACRSASGALCQQVQTCQDQIHYPCNVTCTQRCNKPIAC